MADIRFHYFSVAVRNLEAGMKRYEEYFGLRPVGEITEQRWGFRGVMLGTDEGPMLEMIEPTADDSALKRFMDLRQGEAYPGGEGLYLVGMRVSDLEAAVKRVEDAGGQVTREAETGNAAWVHPLSNGNVFIELLTQPEE